MDIEYIPPIPWQNPILIFVKFPSFTNYPEKVFITGEGGKKSKIGRIIIVRSRNVTLGGSSTFTFLATW